MATRAGLTYEDYAALPDDGRRRGPLGARPANGGRRGALRPVRRHPLPHDGLQPDIICVATARAARVSARGIEGAPTLAIEILSPEDRMNRVEVCINEFLAMGVPYVWIIDPQTRQAYVATPREGLREVKSGVLRTENPLIEVPLAEVLPAL